MGIEPKVGGFIGNYANQAAKDSCIMQFLSSLLLLWGNLYYEAKAFFYPSMFLSKLGTSYSQEIDPSMPLLTSPIM